MPIDLNQFAAAFPSEAVLREKVATLFRLMPRNQDVQIMHGAQEYGKDIVFYSPNGADEFELNACVVKNSKITGSVSGSDGARNVLFQVKQALDTPFINGSGESELVSKIYVVSPHDCSQTTMHSIHGELKERYGQVTFLCGGKLLDKFSKYLPDFLVFESDLLGSYIASLQQSLNVGDPVNAILQQFPILSTQTKTLSKVYVRQNFKQHWQQVSFLPSPPDLSPLRDTTTTSRMSEVVESLVFLRSALSHAQMWDSGSKEDAENAVALIDAVTVRLKNAWEKSYKEHKRLSEEAGKNPFPQHQATLQLLDFDLRAESEGLAILSSAVSELDRRVDKANDLATPPLPTSTQDLFSEDYKNYCSVMEAVRVSPASFKRNGLVTEILYADELLEIGKSILISAPPGHGKTSFCRWNALSDAHRLAEKTSETIPFYVPLHQLSTAAIDTPAESLFFRSEQSRNLASEAMAKESPIRLYLDGLDEVSSDQQREFLIGTAEQFQRKHKHIQMVVTARDYIVGPYLRWLPRVYLAELSPEQSRELALKWLEDGGELDRFQSELARAGTLKPLMRVPLLATLIIAVFKRMSSLPDSRVQLYEIFVDLLCGGWDLAKNIRRDTKYAAREKLAVLTRLAGTLQLNGVREGRESEFKSALLNTIPRHAAHWRTFLDEVLQDGLLAKAGESFAFSHLSFQEYLAAKDLVDPTGGRQEQTLKYFLKGDDLWREVLSFYVGLNSRPEDVENWIKTVKGKVASSSKAGPDIEIRCNFLYECLKASFPSWNPKGRFDL
jgi:hypothetical protein